MKRKLLFGIVFSVLLLTCCISDNGETPVSGILKVDLKDFMLETYEMPGNYSIYDDDDYYLSKDEAKDWAIERGWQGGYKRVIHRRLQNPPNGYHIL